MGSFDSFGLSLANNGGGKHTKKSVAGNSHSINNSKRSNSGGRVLAVSQERRSVREGNASALVGGAVPTKKASVRQRYK